MKKGIFSAVLTLVSLIVAGQTCDYFNYANTNTVTGWTDQSGDWTVFNNQLQAPLATSWNFITYDGSSQTDGCITARVKYSTPSGTQFMGLTGRYNSPSSNIMVKVQDNTSCGYFDSYFIYDGSGSVSYAEGFNFGTDLIMQMEYNGSNVTLRIDPDRNGTWDYTYTATVTVTGSGLCGISSYSTGIADDFCYGTSCCTNPGSPGSITGPTSVCAGDQAVSFSVPTIPNATSYMWQYSGLGASVAGSSENITIDFSVVASGGYLSVYGTNSCGNGPISDSLLIGVSPLPGSGGSINGDDTVCQGQSNVIYDGGPITDAVDYLWIYSGSGVSINGNAPAVQLDFATNATSGSLTVQGENACGTGSVSPPFSVTVISCTSISENEIHMNVSPVPSSGMITVGFHYYKGKANLSVFNIQGELVYSEELRFDSEKTVDLSALNPGSYLISLSTDKGVFTSNIILK